MTLWDEMMRIDGEEIELVVERVEIQLDRTFSKEAMSLLTEQMATFVATRVMRRWDATSEPPSALRVELKVTTS